MIRCIDQTIVRKSAASNYPSNITCTNPNYVVCFNKCVKNEIMCSLLKECSGEFPYLCSNNECTKDSFHCPSKVQCGINNNLCEDFWCRQSCYE